MMNLILTFLLTSSAILPGKQVAGDVSPATSAPCQETNDDNSDNGEVDEDIIITDDEYTNDDEGVDDGVNN